MEDTHISILDLTEDCSLFCVFDGHGGYFQKKKIILFKQNTQKTNLYSQSYF